MGLDMYLETEQYVSDFNNNGKELIDSIQKCSFNGLGDFKPKSVTYELAYWRKANAIHSWFVKNVQGGRDECQSTFVSQEKLKELKEICEKVLENIELADELLPTAAGFFFGSNYYDEWYTSQLEYTIKTLDNILSNPNSNKSWWVTYRSCW